MYRAIELAGGGAHGNVYRGFDTLNRTVAIKFIRPSVGDSTFIRDQAQALARVESDNVISILSIEDVVDPESGQLTPAIVMPWLEGTTLEVLLSGPKLTPEQVKRIGIGMILGMSAIHRADLVHGDFHFKNVMVSDTSVKVIDILYYNSLADDAGSAKELKLQSDRNSLRSLLGDLLTRIDLSQADAFSRSLSPESTLDDIHIAFINATRPKVRLDIQALIESAIARVSDGAFVDGDDYAVALSEEIPDQVIRPLLETLIAKGMTKKEHKAFLRVLWDRLARTDQEHICVDLSTAINREVPRGDFEPHLRMLSALGANGWDTLSKPTTIRLENAIAQDLIAGRFHPQTLALPRGSLGLWVRFFYPHFRNPSEIRRIFNELLRSGWESQNYVGHFFLRFLPRLPSNAIEREILIQSIANAVTSNAWSVMGNLQNLPQDWRDEITAVNTRS